ncbi:MAG: methyltransferase domain-containing protein [Polyangiaceae bacterium]
MAAESGTKGIFGLHFASVSVPRAERIARAFADLAPTGSRTMLDIGCGDGLLAQNVARLVGAESVRGADIKIQPNCRIEAKSYDGLHLPFGDAEFDLVTISDVLHHTSDATQVLREALRVTKPKGAILVKDHFRLGPISNAILLAMDVVGNYAQGIFVRGTYFSPAEWIQMTNEAGGTVDSLQWPFEVHNLPWRVVTRSEFQFVARLRHRAS